LGSDLLWRRRFGNLLQQGRAEGARGGAERLVGAVRQERSRDGLAAPAERQGRQADEAALGEVALDLPSGQAAPAEAGQDQRLGVSLETASLLAAGAVAANVVGNLACGPLLARGVSRARILLAAFAGMALSGFAILGADVPGPLAYAACVAFSAVGGLIPVALLDGAARHAPRWSARRSASSCRATTSGWSPGRRWPA
jgi:Zn-dependent protease